MISPIGQTNEWYTPPEYMEAVRKVLGGIDLDPASTVYANQVVQAARFYTQQDDALVRDWPGRVYLNPPFCRRIGQESMLKLFVGRLLQQYRAGITTEAVLLVPANTATSWFVPLWRYPICFVRKRICFYSEAGEFHRANFANCFVYLGASEQRFMQEFIRFGPLARGLADFGQCEQLELFVS